MTDVVRVFRRSSAALFGLGLVAVMAALAVLAPWLAPRDPDAIDTARRLAPILTAGHPLGTDEFGRDLLSRLLYGARISLVVGLTATALAALAGSLCGLLAGFVGRWVDQLIMRSIDTLMAFPYFLLAVAIIAALGPGLVNGMVAVNNAIADALWEFGITNLEMPASPQRVWQAIQHARSKAA